nr:putative replication/partitioning-related protein [uncultured bacterium]BAH89890.1 putative partitioning protein [uncultured bacterium]BAH90143.1 hypothetical protein [uncultured bacterium]
MRPTLFDGTLGTHARSGVPHCLSRLIVARQHSSLRPRFETYTGADPLAYVVSLNLKRRHLDESERAMVAARIATLPRGANQHAAIAAPSQTQASTLLNVSADSIQRARKVITSGAHDLQAAAKHGEVSVSAAVATLPEPARSEIVAGGDARFCGRLRPCKRLSEGSRARPAKVSGFR